MAYICGKPGPGSMGRFCSRAKGHQSKNLHIAAAGHDIERGTILEIWQDVVKETQESLFDSNKEKES